MKAYILLAMVALFATVQLGFAGAVSCNTANIGFKVVGVSWGVLNSTRINTTQVHISAGPGENDVPLTVTIQSYGTSGNICSLIGVEGQLQVYGGFSNFNGSAEFPAAYIGQLEPGSLFNMVFYLNIAKSVSAGPNNVYIFPLDMYYNYSNYTSRYSQSINVGVPLYGSANLTYSPSTKALGPGLDNLTLTVSNMGSGALYNISTSIASSTGISTISQPQSVGSLLPRESNNITVLLYNPSSTGSSSAALNLVSHFINPYGYNTTESSTIDFYTTQMQQLVTVYPSNQTIIAGKVYNTSILVHNGGGAPIYNVSVALTPQSPLDILGNNSYVVLPDIPANSSASFPLELYSQASSSSSPVDTISAMLAYTANGQAQSSNRDISFLAPGYVNLTQVSLSMLPTTPTVGSIFTITATIDNLGSVEATAASVAVDVPQGLKIVGQNTTFIGSIPIDTPTAFSLSFTATKAGKYTIPVKVEYLNNLNQHLNASFDYQVDVGSGNYSSLSSSSAGSKYVAGYHNRNSYALYEYIAVIAVVIAISLSAYYFVVRKKHVKGHGK